MSSTEDIHAIDSAQLSPTKPDVDCKKEIGMSDHVEHVEGEMPKKHGVNNQMDDAAALIEAVGGPIEASAEDRKRVLRKIDLWVCVPMCIVYCIQSLDKGSVSYAAVFNLQDDAHLIGSEYSWTTSVGYFAQLLFQSVSAYALVVCPVKWWVLFNMTAWSIVTICTAAAKDFAGLMVARVFLGIFEATILPSFVLITQMWWTRREQSFRTIAYQISVSVSGIIGPLLTYGVGKGIAETNNTTIKAYQGIFLFLGAFSLAFVPLVYFMLPNSPTTAHFLRHAFLITLVLGVEVGAVLGSDERYQDLDVDFDVLVLNAVASCVACPSGGIGNFGGLITKGFGFNSFNTILMQVPTGVLGVIILISSIFITNRIKIRFIVICALIVPPIGGAIGLIFIPRQNIRGLLGCYYSMYFYPALQPLLYSWANLNAAGTTKRVVTTACLFIGQCVGNIVGPQVYLKGEAPYYHTGLYVDIGCWALLFLLTVSMGSYLKFLNRKQEAKRTALGFPAKLKDMSIMTTDEAAKYRAALTERLDREGEVEARIFQNAFDDLTDFQNPNFIYVI